jgi:hypothetical protein
MSTAFAGMNPWLEAPDLFPDLQDTLVIYLREYLQSRLPAGYYTAIANRIYDIGFMHSIIPDVSILRKPSDSQGPTEQTVATAARMKLKPIVVPLRTEPMKENYIEIRTALNHQLVTTFEAISPSNKKNGSEGRKNYLHKQQELTEQRVNCVEIDLLRGGEPTTRYALYEVPEFLQHDCPYHISVFRAAEPAQLECYPAAFAEALPAIAIPLKAGDPDVEVPLEEIFQKCYQFGSYDYRIDYSRDPRPELSAKVLEDFRTRITQFRKQP